MRVLHIGKYYAPQRGGIERHVQDLSQWLVRHGVGVGVVAHQPGGRWSSSRETLNGVEVWRVGCVATPLYAPVSPTFPLQLAHAIAQIEPDLIHLHMPNPSCFAALANARARRVPWIVHWHADVSAQVPSWKLRLAYQCYRPFERAVLRWAAAVITTSAAYRDASPVLAEWRSKVRVIPLGIDPRIQAGAIAPRWPMQGALRILAVGRLSHYKGFSVLLDALALLPHGSLLLIGSGECAQALRAQIDRLGLRGRVTQIDDVDDETLRAAYATADVFVLPSLDRSEAFGLVLLEAMRAGAAIVASSIPGSGVGHVVVDQVTGLLVPPGDAGAIAAALSHLSDDPALRSRLGAAGKARWHDEFTLDRSAQAVLDLYRDVLR